MFKHLIVIASLALATLSTATGPAFALSHASVRPMVPERVSTDQCDVAPADIDDIRDVIAISDDDPQAVIDLSAPLLESDNFVDGDAADSVRDLARTYAMCSLIGDVARSVGLYSDAFLVRIGNTVAEMLDATGSSDLADASFGIWFPSSVRDVGDDRYAVSLDIFAAEGTVPEEWTKLLTMQVVAVDRNGVWKIDDLRFHFDRDDYCLVDCPTNAIGDVPADCTEGAAASATPSAIDSPDLDGCDQPSSNHVLGDGYEGWILNGFTIDGDPIWWFGDEFGDVSFLTLEAADIAAAEAGLEDYARTLYTGSSDIADHFADGTYLRQYIGYETDLGRVLVINAFAVASNVVDYYDVSTDLVVVSDGGDYFWKAVYNLDADEFISFNVNNLMPELPTNCSPATPGASATIESTAPNACAEPDEESDPMSSVPQTSPTAEPREGNDCATDADGCRVPQDARAIEGTGYSGWIMPVELAEGTGPAFLDAETARGAWPFMPSDAHVATVEAELPAYLSSHPDATHHLLDELGTGFYTRQYLGFDTASGLLLVINAFCNPPDSFDPAKGLLSVQDGGDCNWQAVYNLDTGEFLSFSVNGEA